MAINFPDSPSNEDTFTANGKTFVYNSANTSWRPQTAAESGGTDFLADMAALIAKTGMSNGDQALVQSNNNLYMYSGSGWYKIATIQNDAPSAITGVDGSYTLALDGTATTITAVSTDPEGFALTWSYTASGLGSIATVSQVDNVFTVTPSTDAANAGSFTLTISATDGINGAVSTIPSFTLAFSVTNSRYTALSVKATNTGSNQTFDDASTSNHTITVAGDTTASTFSPHRHGGYSAYLDGTGDFLQSSGSVNIAGDWTIEGWYYFTTLTGAHSFFTIGDSASQANSMEFLIHTTGELRFYNMGGGYSNQHTPPADFLVNNWIHIAVVRSGTGTNNIKAYINGTQSGTGHTSNNDLIGKVNIGTELYNGAGSWFTQGYIQDFRVSSIARYTANFTPPTEPLTAITNTKFLLGQLPYFKDQSASNHAIAVNGDTSLRPKSVFDNAPYSEASHGASAYFDGTTGNRLTIPHHADFDFSGDFVLEFWCNLEQTGNNQLIFDKSIGANNNWQIYTLSSNDKIGAIITDSSSNTIVSYSNVGPVLVETGWHHFSLVRDNSAGTYVSYIDGVVVDTTTSSANCTSTNEINIGAMNSSDTNMTKGYISDFKFLTTIPSDRNAAFTPPTAPSTPDSNTKFLLNPETSISDLSQRNSLITVGGAAASTTQVKFSGTKSIYIGAQGDYINSIRDSTTPIFPNGDSQDWTLEYWYYPTNIAGWNSIFNIGNGLRMYALNGGLGIIIENGGSVLIQQNQMHTVTENTWSHVAIVRNGNNYNVYVDGVSRFNTTNSNEVQTGTNNLHIGDITPYNNGALNFYIQDFRITKGLARYTANFTPPTAELDG